MSLLCDKGCIQCAACLPTFLACCWPCPARSSVSSSCHAPHHNATRAVLFRTLRGLRLRRARTGEQLRPPGRERTRRRLGQCRLVHEDWTLSVHLARSFDASQAWSPRFRTRWQRTRVQYNVRPDTTTFLKIPAATGPNNYDRLSRAPAQHNNYDHLAGSTPPVATPNNYDRLGPRSEANSDGYCEAAAIAGAEAPVYHATQRAAEPASGRCVMILPRPRCHAV